MRIVLALLTVGAGVAAAVAIGSHRVHHSAVNCVSGGFGSRYYGPCSWATRPNWVVPVAIMVGFAGVAAGVGIIASGRPAHSAAKSITG